MSRKIWLALAVVALIAASFAAITWLVLAWIIEKKPSGNFSERTQIFEPVPLELFAEVFTEMGATRPGRLFSL